MMTILIQGPKLKYYLNIVLVTAFQSHYGIGILRVCK